MKLLLVDDDTKYCATIQQGLEEFGHTCFCAGSYDEALSLLRGRTGGRLDAILLDIMLPERSGWEILEQLRAAGDETPVLFVTARDSVDERVQGLRDGADDYIIKPFAFTELLARVEAVVRRRRSLPELEVGDFLIDLARRKVTRKGEPVELTPLEFDLLVAFAENPDRVLSREELRKSVWNIEFDPGTNVVDVHVARLRRKLDRRGARLIRTVVGEGYALTAQGEPA